MPRVERSQRALFTAPTTGVGAGEKPRREVAEPGSNRRDRERSGLAGDGAGAGGRSLGRRRAEGVLRRPEERTPKKHGSKEAGGVSGPRPQDNRTRSRGRENTGSDPLDT
ncbi:hypothetical protein NDU88_005596 [Pleurodeles waltl]|uniref:Uncharacterized protein n=1 Tax=Pleurodeles waltl TaxID=8319 RepID=A0AAV7W8A2_PLEWA|nr:hypothetical protein NDU88_005596 [Pleurodeles waltl]